ncbi:WD40/YVTN/BNR-like repeat-containing protein [Streptomyces sp. CB03234]|uniref:WD40/YVTN/BNR-like repeat-containing protein n=1 Tax=Streptomyces sp. (strain CB03234) TaxID=1703937 RepID=UPI001F527838|nr:sialidase family protein [Streptomyces sp. CB03234]
MVMALSASLLAGGCTGEGAPDSRPPAPSRSESRSAPSQPAPQSVPSQPESPSSVPPLPRVPSAPELPGWTHSLGFAADGSGFALLAQCVEDEVTPVNGFCRQHLAVLDRGAARWVLRPSPLPEVHGTAGVSAVITVLGPGRALIRESSERHPLRTWFTTDAGRSWRLGDLRAAGTADAIPEGAVLSTQCPGSAGPLVQECARPRLVVISPEDGKVRFLAREPRLGAHPAPAGEAEPDGSWWVSGTDPRSGGTTLAVSRDAGRTWTVSRLPSPGADPAWGVAVSVGPDAVYAAERGEVPGVEPAKNPLRALHRSVDGGRTWTRVWVSGPQREPRTLMGVPVAGPGGRLVVHGERGTYAGTDGGRTFRDAGPGMYHVTRGRLGYLRSAAIGCAYGISPDGVRWVTFRLACQDGTDLHLTSREGPG